MAKKQRDEGGGYNFMDTYGDMMTLLLTFFVLLFSMSSVQQEKFELLVKAFTNRTGETAQIVLAPEADGDSIGEIHGSSGEIHIGEESEIDIENTVPETFDELFEYFEQYIAQNNMEESIKVEKTGKNTIFIRFEDNIFFYPDSELMKDDSLPILEFIGRCIKNVEDKIMVVRIGGHTADPGIANYVVSDRILSTNRANAVLMYLEDVKKFDAKKLVASGYGKNYPIADNSTPEGRSKNRRVEMFIIGNEADLTSQEEMYEIIENALKVTLNNNEEKIEDTDAPADNSQEQEENDISQNHDRLTDLETSYDGLIDTDEKQSEPKEEENSTEEDGDIIPPPN